MSGRRSSSADGRPAGTSASSVERRGRRQVGRQRRAHEQHERVLGLRPSAQPGLFVGLRQFDGIRADHAHRLQPVAAQQRQQRGDVHARRGSAGFGGRRGRLDVQVQLALALGRSGRFGRFSRHVGHRGRLSPLGCHGRQLAQVQQQRIVMEGVGRLAQLRRQLRVERGQVGRLQDEGEQAQRGALQFKKFRSPAGG